MACRNHTKYRASLVRNCCVENVFSCVVFTFDAKASNSYFHVSSDGGVCNNLVSINANARHTTYTHLLNWNSVAQV
jgi:hypothetical protein